MLTFYLCNNGVYMCMGLIDLLLCICLPVTHRVYLYVSPAYSIVPDMSWAFSHVIYVCSLFLCCDLYIE